jgi:hypothetical protein
VGGLWEVILERFVAEHAVRGRLSPTSQERASAQVASHSILTAFCFGATR